MSRETQHITHLFDIRLHEQQAVGGIIWYQSDKS